MVYEAIELKAETAVQKSRLAIAKIEAIGILRQAEDDVRKGDGSFGEKMTFEPMLRHAAKYLLEVSGRRF